jgi:hypothetical protein
MSFYRRWRLIDDAATITLARLSGKVSNSFEMQFGYDTSKWPTDVLAYSPNTRCYYRFIAPEICTHPGERLCKVAFKH